jgi:deoxyribose-phosphate aldolase
MPLVEDAMSSFSCEQIAKAIDHSVLRPTLTDVEQEAECRKAGEWGVASVCARPCFIARARELLEGSEVSAGTVVGFPHGGHAISIKVAESRAAVQQGAQELDMVVNIGKVRSADWRYLEDEIAAVVEAGHEGGALVKVIFENCYLTEDEKKQLCGLSKGVGADFIKTSTGFGTGGATDADLRLMLAEAGGEVGVKAAGGIRTYADAVRVLQMGVKRIGASQTEHILAECERQSRG